MCVYMYPGVSHCLTALRCADLPLANLHFYLVTSGIVDAGAKARSPKGPSRALELDEGACRPDQCLHFSAIKCHLRRSSINGIDQLQPSRLTHLVDDLLQVFDVVGKSP